MTGYGGRIRQAARLAGIAAWTAFSFVLWSAGALALVPAADARRRWRLASFRRWAGGVAWLLGMRRVVEGSPPADAPFILVTNHVSYMDIILLASIVPGVFVAKREVQSWPVWGILAGAMRTIFVDRERRRDALRVSDQIHEALTRGDGVILFPEGTSTDGRQVRPLKPALLEVAARHGYPVHYARVSYRTPPGAPPAHLAVSWWGDMEFGSHFVELCRLPGFQATVTFGKHPIMERDRKGLAQKLHLALTQHVVPAASEESQWQHA
jgi:1-acyl-sn-glycerol-3-phosphate acyltransferase